MDLPQVLVSVPYASPWAKGLPPVEGVITSVYVRAVDWRVSRATKLRQVARDAWRTFRASRQFDAVVICTTSIDAAALCLLLRARPKQRVVVYDFLLPRSKQGRLLCRLALRRVDIWLVIRRGDADTFTRLLSARRSAFVPFPAFDQPTEADADEQVVYAAGIAHRDWSLMLEACAMSRIPAVLSTSAVLPPVPGVLQLPLLGPSEGKKRLARSAVVCVPLRDTHLPCGPLVVLDALAAGKALVATDVNGTRDYVEDGRTGVLVPPGDAMALGSALRRLLDDDEERRRLGQAALQSAARFAPVLILREILQHAVAREHLAGRAR